MTPVRRCLAETGCAGIAQALFPDAELIVLDGPELRPQAAFDGPLFAVLEAVGDGLRTPGADPSGEAEVTPVAGLVVPGVWRGTAGRPSLAAVADHVNLALRGPLTGRWPAGVPRAFPCMTGIYQPGLVRSTAAASLYSEDVVVAGVGDAARLTAFERRVLDEGGYPVSSDCLVPAAIVAAYYRVNLAAGIVPAGP